VTLYTSSDLSLMNKINGYRLGSEAFLVPVQLLDSLLRSLNAAAAIC
jgi:hypothetical protein